MVGPLRGQQVAITSDALRIEIGICVAVEHRGVPLRMGVRDHPTRDIGTRNAVPLVDTDVGPLLPRGVQMHRAQGTRRLRHPDDEQGAALDLLARHARTREQVRADLLWVVDRVPQIALDLVHVLDPANIEAPVAPLRQSKHDDPAIRVGERAIGLPERRRQPAAAIRAARELGLECPAFPEDIQLVRDQACTPGPSVVPNEAFIG